MRRGRATSSPATPDQGTPSRGNEGTP
jgi:hypothetical protein